MKISIQACMNIRANEPYLVNAKARGELQLIMVTIDSPQ